MGTAMSDAAAARGYVTDARYTETFFRELSPVWLNYVAALNGVAIRPLDVPFRYLELGCGLGGSTVVHAGAFPHAEFHGCDVNAAHVAGARRHAGALDVRNVHFHETTFAALAGRHEPPFDFIVLHGVYSWVDAAAREAVRHVIAERLAPGGLVYVSYNCMPGWAAEVPLRRLLVELSATAPGTAEARADDARSALEHLARAKLRYFGAHPEAAQAIASYARQPVEYLAHEFLNDAWEPFYSVDVADEMATAGVTYAGSATLPDNHAALVLDAGAAQAIAALPDRRVQQLALDFAVNRRFRRDVFVRDEDRLDDASARRQLETVPIGCLTDPLTLPAAVRVPRGELRLQDDFIADLKPLLVEGARPLGTMVGALSSGRGDANQILRNLTYLIAGGALTPFAAAAAVPSASPRPTAAPVLARVLALITEERVPRAVPSAVLGNGVPIDPSQAEALTAWLAAGTDPRAPAGAGTLPETLRRTGLLT
jgi:SAM-dependent methyltransferase